MLPMQFNMEVTPPASSTHLPAWASLKFLKDGDQIKTAIDRKVVEIAGKVETARLRVGEFCKEAQIDPTAFLAATGVERDSMIDAAIDRTTNGTGDASVHAKAHEGAALLRRWTKRVDNLQTFADDLLAVKKNIEPNRRFDLSFNELLDFGFAL